MRIAIASLIADAASVRAAERLVRSLRWFGGAAAVAPMAFVAMPTVEGEARAALAGDGVAVHVAGIDWRPRMAEVVAGVAADLVLLLASDCLVLQEPTPVLAPGELQVLAASPAGVSPEQRARVSGLAGLADPAFPDWDPSIVGAPPAVLAALLARWLAHSQAIAAAPEILGEQAPWRDAVAFSLAVAGSATPHVVLDPTLALAPHAPLPVAWDPTVDARIVRGAITDPDGRLGYTPYPFVQARLERLNRRLAGHERPSPARTGCTGQPPAQVLILGMHRSGTSLLASLLASTGLHVGAEEDFPPADAHNAKGYFELLDVWAIDEALLRLAGASWDTPFDGHDVALSADARTRLTVRARALVDRLDRQGPWVVKDPRLSLLLPFWRPLLAHPVAVLVYRDPLAVARSLAARDGFDLARGVALWERYNRAALAATDGMPRLVVAHRDLLERPRVTLEHLVDGLATAGVRGVVVPSAETIAARVEPALDHHRPGDVVAGPTLTDAQHALLATLERARARADSSCEVRPRSL